MVEYTVIAVGAESEILRTRLWSRELVVKRRPAKPYLHDKIDAYLRRYRTVRECKMLAYARGLGIPTPAVYAVDLAECSIVMDYVDGVQLKELVGHVSPEQLVRLCKRFGEMIAGLHRGDVVHGDPTTSNVLVEPSGRMWIVDFGLADVNATVEMKGVDLHLVRRALETTHWQHQEQMLKAVLDGYQSIVGDGADEITRRMEEIRQRGRYH